MNNTVNFGDSKYFALKWDLERMLDLVYEMVCLLR